MESFDEWFNRQFVVQKLTLFYLEEHIQLLGTQFKTVNLNS